MEVLELPRPVQLLSGVSWKDTNSLVSATAHSVQRFSTARAMLRYFLGTEGTRLFCVPRVFLPSRAPFYSSYVRGRASKGPSRLPRLPSNGSDSLWQCSGGRQLRRGIADTWMIDQHFYASFRWVARPDRRSPYLAGPRCSPAVRIGSLVVASHPPAYSSLCSP